MINYFSEEVDFPKISGKVVSKWIKTIARQYEKKVGKITYIFCSDEYILKINNEFLQHDYYTDIITFDYSSETVISGDIFISTETVTSNAEKFNQPFETELYRVIIHGILHLCGQKDTSEEEKAEMTAKENRALEAIY